MKYQLAEVLHKTVAELDEIPQEEFEGWQAHFERKRKERP